MRSSTNSVSKSYTGMVSFFICRLLVQGFRKIDPGRYKFAQENFIRGKRELLPLIRRRKKPQAMDKWEEKKEDEDNISDPMARLVVR